MVKIKREDLLKALATVRKAVATQDMTPMLTHFLVEDGEITATDMDIGIVAEFPPLKGMDFVVPADRFYKLIAKLPHEFINMSLKDNQLSITTKGHKSKLITSPPSEEFPRIKREFRRWFDAPGQMIAALGYCLKTMDQARGPAFGAVLWSEDGFVSSDTRTITWCPSKGKCPETPVLLSGKFVREAVRLGHPIGWVVHNDSICFNYGETQLLGHLVEAPFPEQWKTYFPEEQPKQLVELSADVKKALSRVGTFSENDPVMSDRNTVLTFDKKALVLNYADPEGSIEEEIDLENPETWNFQVNSSQLSDALSVCSKAAFIAGAGKALLYLEGDEGWPRVIMLVKLAETGGNDGETNKG